MAAKKATVKLAFEPVTATHEHTMTLTKVEYDEKGKRKVVPAFEGLPMRKVIKKGDIFELPKEVFDALVESGQVRSKKQMKEREQLIKDKKPIYEMDDNEKFMMLFDLPYEVE